MTPSSGNGFGPQDFVFRYSDADGATNMKEAQMLTAVAVSGSQSCYSYIWINDPGTAVLYLSNDAGNGWVGSYYLGWATTIQNSQCKVHLANSSLSKSGNQVTVTLRIEFFAGYAGSYNWYMLSTDWQGNMTNWDDRGDWTVGTGGGGGAPQLSNVSPSSGSGLGPQTFTVTVTDAQGAGNVKEVALLTSAGAMNVAQSCYFYVWANSPGTPVLYLVDDAGTGTLGSYYVGWPNTTMQNSQCRIDLGASTWGRSGNVFTLGLRVTFFAGYAGAKNWWAWGSDWDGHTVGWTDVGDWTVGSGGDTTPPVISGVGHGGVTSSGATVSWATDEASDSQVQFGNSTAYGSWTVLNPAMVTSHSVFVPAAPGTTVYYKVWSRNAAGLLAGLAGPGPFTAASGGGDTTPPVITGVQPRGITSNGATISWTTNEPATTLVRYGAAPNSWIGSVGSSTLSYPHSQPLSNLRAGTYYYEVESVDAAGNRATRAGPSPFTTTGSFSLTLAPVNAGNDVPVNLNVGRGKGVSYSVTVTGLSGFSGNVALSLSGLASGTFTWSLTPTVVAVGGKSTLMIQPSAVATVGAHGFTVAGSGDGVTATVGAAVNVMDQRMYLVEPNPRPVTSNVCLPLEPCTSWEPAIAAGPNDRWAAGWFDLQLNEQPPSISRFATKQDGVWRSTEFKAGGTTPLADPYLAWDGANGRFVFCGVESGVDSPSVWYGHEETAGWASHVVFQGGSGNDWDYPSIAVDSAGRVIVGAFRRQDRRFYVRIRPVGTTVFGPQVEIPTSPDPGFTGEDKGPYSRVVATGGRFQVFVPITETQRTVPRGIERWVEGDSPGTWIQRSIRGDDYPPGPGGDRFTEGRNEANLGGPTDYVFYGPLIDARGSPTGDWSVAFPLRWTGPTGKEHVNIATCVSNRGGAPACAFVNQAQEEQFLGNTSLAPLPGGGVGYWFTYHAFQSVTYPDGTVGTPPRPPPPVGSTAVQLRAVYFTSGFDSPAGDVLRSGIDARTWRDIARCTDVNGFVVACRGAGDYVGIASNAASMATAAYLDSPAASRGANDLWVVSPSEPPAPLRGSNFLPVMTAIPRTMDMRALNGFRQPPARELGIDPVKRNEPRAVVPPR